MLIYLIHLFWDCIHIFCCTEIHVEKHILHILIDPQFISVQCLIKMYNSIMQQYNVASDIEMQSVCHILLQSFTAFTVLLVFLFYKLKLIYLWLLETIKMRRIEQDLNSNHLESCTPQCNLSDHINLSLCSRSRIIEENLENA